MRMLIRIVFVIFIANGIDCLGSVCNDCCDCFKDKKAISLVNVRWYNSKKNKPVLKIFIKEENGVFKDNGNKVSFKLEGKNNLKIAYQNEKKDPLKLGGQKYALFEIIYKEEKEQKEEKETKYLYCRDIESCKDKDRSDIGIFSCKGHISISVISCDTEKVTDMNSMFGWCSSLEKLNIQSFNTINVKEMQFMFCDCNELENLDIKNFNTPKVTNMKAMFRECSSLNELNLQNFDTTNVTNMVWMFYECSNLTELDLKNFNTRNVTDMKAMFMGCKKLTKLNIENFDTINVEDMEEMFYGCKKLEIIELKKNFNTKNFASRKGMVVDCSSLSEENKNRILDINV